MIPEENKISFRQGMFIGITMIYSTMTSTIPFYAAHYGKQAAWLSPIISFVFLMIIFVLYGKIYKKTTNKSLMQILSDTVGKKAANFILTIYLFWFLILQAMHVKYYAERLHAQSYPNMKTGIIVAVMLITVAIIVRFGITVIARMNDILLIILNLEFFAIILLVCNQINLDDLTPISYLDIFPVIKASFGVTSILSYILIIFFISDKMDYKDKIVKQGLLSSAFVSISTITMLMTMIGIFSYSVLERIPEGGVMAVKQLTFMGSAGGIEAYTVTLWVTADFILIAAITLVMLNIIKFIFNLKETNYLINLIMILTYFFSLYISSSRFELDRFWSLVETPASLILQLFLPLMIFTVDRIKRSKLCGYKG